ncbi:MAG: hypothetical protein AB1942_03775 [Pseudomonadota bacterium]
MDFLKILRSFEDFIFEAATWMLFYPLTMWRIVSRPLSTMRYSDSEQSDREDGRYDDAISPPLLLLFTLVLVNFIAFALHVPAPEGSSILTSQIVSSPQNLALFRSLVFSLLPLIAAVALLVAQRTRLSRATIRPPFYAQCYLAAPVTVAINLGGLFYQRAEVNNAWAAAVMIAAALWFMATQTRWFASKLQWPLLRAFGLSCGVVVLSGVYLLILLIPVALL